MWIQILRQIIPFDSWLSWPTFKNVWNNLFMRIYLFNCKFYEISISHENVTSAMRYALCTKHIWSTKILQINLTKFSYSCIEILAQIKLLKLIHLFPFHVTLWKCKLYVWFTFYIGQHSLELLSPHCDKDQESWHGSEKYYKCMQLPIPYHANVSCFWTLW